MIDIVEADANELADPAHRLGDAHIIGHHRQCRHVDARQRCGQAGKQRAVDIGDDPGKAADLPLAVEHARLFVTTGSVTQQFH